jgi:PAS domain S-box-containing protein
MKRYLRILHLEDNPRDAETIRLLLTAEGFEFDHVVVKSKAEFELAAAEETFDVVFATATVPDCDPDEALSCIRRRSAGLPFIVVSESVGEERAVEMLTHGASDYVGKTRLYRLGQALTRALTHAEAIGLQRQAEERLRLNEALFRKIMENIDDLIGVIDLHGRRVFNSASYGALLGEVDLTRGTEAFEEVHPEDRPYVRRLFKETGATGQSRRAEYRILIKDGSLRDIESQSSAIRDANGKISQVLVVSRDITARKLAEEKIRDQATWLDKAQDAICVKDLSQTVLYWNKAAERLYGWRAEEAVGRSANDLLLLNNQEPALTALRELIRRGEWKGELHQNDRQGRQLIVESRWNLLRDEHGNPKSILVINTDVTEKRQTEAKFLRNQRMESIGALAGGIAHDLNNALAPILMAADLLGSEIEDPASKKLLETMRSSAQRSCEMVRQILSFARGVTGGHRRLQLNHLLFDLEAFVRSTFPPGVLVNRKVARDLRFVQGDPTQLHQVLLNLAVNARDAMPKGGAIHFEARNVTVDSTFPNRQSVGPHVMVSVGDTGHGIPAEILGKIFEPFFTTKEVGKGTGLGLSTALGIVKTHGGFIDVTSAPGEGTTFKVYIPADSDMLPPVDIKHPMLPAGRGELLLVVDDDRAILEIMKLNLEANDYQIVTATNGAEAIEAYSQRKEEIKLVVTDLLMPVMNGMELTRRLRLFNPALKVIGISGRGPTEETQGVAQPALQGFLTKPFTSEALLTGLHQALNNEAEFRSGTFKGKS